MATSSNEGRTYLDTSPPMDIGILNKITELPIPPAEILSEGAKEDTTNNIPLPTSPLLNPLPISFGEIKSISSINTEYNNEHAQDVKNRVNACIDYFNSDVLNSIRNAETAFGGLNSETITQLSYLGIAKDILFEILYNVYKFYSEDLKNIVDDITEVMKGMEAGDNDPSGDKTPDIPEYGTGGGGGSSSGGSSIGNSTISDIITEPSIDSPILSSATIFGTIVLTEVVTLYETIGGVGTQATLTGNYSVIGIIKENDKYYYKIYDNDAQKVYYMEMTDDVKFQTEYKNLLHIKENAMMLSSMEIGSDNFVKLADPNTIYFIQNETENNGIIFYNVIDASDGKSYYIPASDSVETIPLDSIASIVDTPTTETTTVTGEGV